MTLAYFQLLQAVKDSDFLNVAALSPHTADAPSQSMFTFERPTKGAAAASQDWQLLDTEAAAAAQHHNPAQVFVTQVLVSADKPVPASNQLASVVALDQHLRHAPTTDQHTFNDHLCFHTPKGQCFSASVLNDAQHPGSVSLFYGLREDSAASWPPAPALRWTDDAAEVTFAPLQPAWPGASAAAAHDHQHTSGDNPDSAASPSGSSASSSASGLGITLPLSPKQGRSYAADELASWQYHASRSTIREMAGLKWAFYAARAFVLRFWSLAMVRALSRTHRSF